MDSPKYQLVQSPSDNSGVATRGPPQNFLRAPAAAICTEGENEETQAIQRQEGEGGITP